MHIKTIANVNVPQQENAADDRQLIAFIEAQASRAFERSEAPKYGFPLSAIAETFFAVLRHRLGDPELDAVGSQVLRALASYHDNGDFLNLPDRLEAFLKFIQRLLKPVKASASIAVERVFLPEVLEALGLARASGLGTQDLAHLEGKPRFAWYIERAVRARNEVHRAPAYNAREKAEILESVCVVMLFSIAERKEQIGLALLVSAHRQLLQRYRDTFDKWRERFVDLESQEQLTEDFEGIDPLAVEIIDEDVQSEESPDGSDTENLETGESPNPQLQLQRRGFVRDLINEITKLVLLGGPGAGKTTTLQFLAWHAASALLKNPGNPNSWFPVYVPLKTFGSTGVSTLEAAIQAEASGLSLKELATQRCLLLLDGLNEVPQEHLIAAKHEVQAVVNFSQNFRVVLTCRPGQFQNEFAVPVFDLQPLKDEQIQIFFQKHLRDPEKVGKLMSLARRHPKLWEWSRNPFMLAMLVRVFLRHSTLPENRGSLMRLFLSDIMKREQAQGAARTALTTKSSLLARLAYETRRLAQLSFSRTQACAHLKGRRDELGSTLDVPLFIDEALNNNLLALTNSGLLTFDHELYQEYFCAVALQEMGEAALALIDELQQESRWEEPIIFYSGICEYRDQLLRRLSDLNVLLASKALTSAAVDEPAARQLILSRATSLAAESCEPLQVAHGLLTLAELGEAEGMINVLRQRGAQDATARQAIQSFLPKCPPDLIVGWVRRTSDLSDKFLITWMLAAIAADQKEILLRDYREILKELLLWQVKRSWQGKAELRHLLRLFEFFGKDYNSWLARSISKDILDRVDNGADEQWGALRHLYHQGFEITASALRPALFTAAINRSTRASTDVAVLIWSEYLHEDLSTVQELNAAALTSAIRLLRKTRDIRHYKLSLCLAKVHRSHLANALSANPRLVRASTSRLERLSTMDLGEIHRNCRVKSLTPFGAFLEFEPNQDALLHLADLTWRSADETGPGLALDQRIDVVVLEIDDPGGNVMVGLKQMPFALLEIARSQHPIGSKVRVKVSEVGQAGAVVDLRNGVKATIPRKELSWNIHGSPADLVAVGQELEVLVSGVDARTSQLELSRRLLEPDPWDTMEHLCAVGTVVSGKVVNIVDFGAFIRLQTGISGLLHLNEISWSKLKHPSVALKVGQELELVVLEVRKEKRRLSLSLKKRLTNPWASASTKYLPGKKVKGKVSQLVPYGAFIELEPGIEGLVHITELSWQKRDVKPKDVLTIGEDVEVLVLEVEPSDEKISLSVKRLSPSPWDTTVHRYYPGARVTGKVRNMTSYGAFIELEQCLDGMIHVSDISWTRKITHPSEVFKKGDTIEAVVLEVDSGNQRLALGIKQLTSDPWETIDRQLRVGNVLSGNISRLVSFGVFVALENGIEGLVHNSEIPSTVDRSILQSSQTILVRVLSIDKGQREIGLSMKEADQSS